jgi:hypothetical protein
MDRQGFRNTCCSALLLLLGAAAAPSFGQDSRPLRAVEEEMQAGLKHRCNALETLLSAERATSQPNAARSMALEAYEGERMIQCQCLPGELKKAVAAQPGDALVTEQSFAAMLRTHVEKCAARGIRETLSRRCDRPDNQDVAAADLTRYCECLNQGMAALSDQQLVESSQAARRHFEAKVKAVNGGTPQPAREPSALDGVSSSCRKQHGSRG